MSAAPRGPDRRQQGRREVDVATHLLEQGVLSAAVMFIELESDAAAAERIAAHRTLRDRVQDYLKHSEEGATTTEWLAMGAIAAAVVVPAELLGLGQLGKWVAIMVGLSACAWLLWTGERGRR